MLASPWSGRKAAYDFAVVGSGYGGAILAARLALSGVAGSVCILERGREWPLGSFPDEPDGVMREQRSSSNPHGLYETLHFRDISVLKACGLGGGSLINFNAAVRPDREVFVRGDWPGGITRESLEPWYEKAAHVLCPTAHPRASELPKFRALDRAAQALGARAQATPITVNFAVDGLNAHGMKQAPCNGCGNCFAGCNYGGKNTLYQNYLPMARRAGAEIFTTAKVEWIEKLEGGGWRVHGRVHDDGREGGFKLDARNVVLAAGAINSTEILLRSEMHGLRVSPRLGSAFSGNGDFFGTAYNSDVVVEAIGISRDRIDSRGVPGPALTGTVFHRTADGTRFLVQDTVIPSAYAGLAQLAMASFRGEDTDTGDEQAERARVLYDLAQKDPLAGGALRNTLYFLVTSADDARGSIVFESPWWERDGRIDVQWDGAGRQAVFSQLNTSLRSMARALGSTYIENVFWSALDLRRLITLHPLGGCPMGEDYLQGAADEYGRVFSGDGSVHAGLLVADGALIPSAIGANPLMTISALAERIADRKIRELRGEAHPEAPVTVSMAGFDGTELVGARDQVIERLFRRSTHIGSLERMQNADEYEVDVAARRIRNNANWKGFLPQGLPLNELSNRMFSGYHKRFWRDGDKWLGETRYLDGRVPLGHVLEEITVERRTGDLDSGRYVLLRYTDPPFNVMFYDIMKMIADDVVLYRGYTGIYPHGRRGWTAPLLRGYRFEQMSALDHERLFAMGSTPGPEDLEGLWRMDAVANSNHAAGVAWLQFDRKPDGRLEARYQLLNLIEGMVLPAFLTSHFQLHDFTPFHDEIRRLDRDVMVGWWVTELPRGLAELVPAGSLGLLHAEKTDGGRTRMGFRYLLTRGVEGDKPASVFEALSSVRVPDGTGLSFEERAVGQLLGSDCRLDLKIDIPDLQAFLDDPSHEARCGGTVTFDGWGTFAVSGRLDYLRVDPDTREAEITYELRWTADGRSLMFVGRRLMQKHSAGAAAAAEVLEDYTTLHAAVIEGGREAGTGVLRFGTLDGLSATGNLADFLLSFRVTGATDPSVKARARMAFLGFTLRFIQHEYDPLSPDVGGLAGDVRVEIARGAETPDYFSTLATGELQAVLRDASTRPLAELVNTGAFRVDHERRRIYRDSFWKGSFAKDTLLGWEERVRTAALAARARDFAGGSFWKRFDQIEDGAARGHVVNYEVHLLPGDPEVREVEYPDNNRRYFRQGDKVLLLRYRNEPYRIVYDVIKIIDGENAIGVMHLGEFPHGVEFSTFVMARHNYPFEQMTTDDHRWLWERAAPAESPTGSWRGTLLLTAAPSLVNQANPEILEVNGPEYRLRGGLKLPPPSELRRLEDETLLGLWNGNDLLPELFLRAQNCVGSGAKGLEVRCVLTRAG